MNKKLTLLAAGLTALTLSGCGVKYAYELTSPEETTVKAEETVSLSIRYFDEKYTEYLRNCGEAYEKTHKNVEINLELAAPENYVQGISDDTVLKGAGIDLYMASNSDLGTLYLAGLAAKNTANEYNNSHYCQTALDACSYKGSLVAYPLGYETSFLVYNTDFLTEENVKTFANMENYSTEIDLSSEEAAGIESIFRCNISQMFGNYGFIGAGMTLGGVCGDDPSDFEVNNSLTVKAAEDYLSLIDYFSLKSDVSYEDCVEQFTSGRILATVVRLDAVADIEAGGVNYGIAGFPDYDGKSKTAPLSITTALVVNPYSLNQELAADFARYATYERADKFYEETGTLSTKRNAYCSDSELEKVYDSYDKSVSKNKLLYGEQVYPLIEIALHNIVAGEDIKAELQKIDDYMKTQLQ
ncbi:MAG: extracellular solute-binding protein [Butyrivibrio sp.]|nr:extracellular solute-binding protein [Butyrivibrio sp.]